MAKLKYKNKPTARIINGETVRIDSRKEARRLDELILLLKAKKISKLIHQPSFELQEKFTDRHGVKHRSISYIGDFKYTENGEEVVEDVKSEITRKLPVFSMKKKLLIFKYPHIKFIES